MAKPKAGFRSIWKLLEGEHLRFGSALGVLVLAASILYLVPLIPQAVIDGVLAEPTDATSRTTLVVMQVLGGREFLTTHLWVPLLAIAGITLLAGAFIYLRQRFCSISAQNTARRMREKVYDHIQRLPCRTLDGRDSGDLLQRCTSDVDTMQMFIQTHLVEVGRAIVMLLVPLPLMFMMDWRMTLAAIWAQPLTAGFGLIFYRKVRNLFRLKDEAEGRMTSSVNENLTGIRIVRAFNRQDHEIERFNKRNDQHRVLDEKIYRAMAWYYSMSDLLCFIQQASVIFIGAWLLYNGMIEVGQFYFFFAAVGMFLWPIRMLGRLLSEMGKATVAIERLQEILALPIESNPADPIMPEQFHGRIAFKDVSLTYDQSTPVLHDVSFTISEGETIALMGPSGSGKSTIANILLRFNDLNSGSVELDGVDIERIPRQELRLHIAAVMQQPFLFSRSIRENVSLGVSHAQEETLQCATRMAHMHESISSFEHGYETLVGERGVTLSGGQRQRIAIAQALLQEPAVLILDDALSAVDTGHRTSHPEGLA